MAGYKRNKVFVLKFLDEQFNGLVVEAGHATYAEYLEIRDMAYRPTPTKEKAIEDATAAYTAVFGKLRSWNLENDDDTPVELTLENFLKQDKEFTANVTGAWLDAVSGASLPLGKPSENGDEPSKPSVPDDDELALMSSIPMSKPPLLPPENSPTP